MSATQTGTYGSRLAELTRALLGESREPAAIVSRDGLVRWANDAFGSTAADGTSAAHTFEGLEPSARAALIAAIETVIALPLTETRHLQLHNGSSTAVDVALTHVSDAPEHLVLYRPDGRAELRSRLERAARLESTLRRMTAELTRLAAGERGDGACSASRHLTPLPTEMPARQRQIAELVLRGVDVEEIARQLELSPHTVRNHLKAVFRRVGVHSRAELLARFST